MGILDKLRLLYSTFRDKPIDKSNIVAALEDTISSTGLVINLLRNNSLYSQVKTSVIYGSTSSSPRTGFYKPSLSLTSKQETTQMIADVNANLSMFKSSAVAHVSDVYATLFLTYRLPTQVIKKEKEFPFSSMINLLSIIDTNLNLMSQNIRKLLDQYPTNTIPQSSIDVKLSTIIGYLNGANITVTWIMLVMKTFMERGIDTKPWQVKYIVDNERLDLVREFMVLVYSRPNTIQTMISPTNKLVQAGMNYNISDIEDISTFSIDLSKVSPESSVLLNHFFKDALVLGIGRLIIGFRHMLYERNISIREWLISKVEQNERARDRSTSPAETAKIQATIDKLNDRIAQCSQKIKGYEDELRN